MIAVYRRANAPAAAAARPARIKSGQISSSKQSSWAGLGLPFLCEPAITISSLRSSDKSNQIVVKFSMFRYMQENVDNLAKHTLLENSYEGGNSKAFLQRFLAN